MALKKLYDFAKSIDLFGHIRQGLVWLKEKIIAFGTWLKTHWKSVLKVFLWVNPITAPIMALNKLVKFVFGINLFEAGKKIIESLWHGIKSFAMKPVEAVKGVLQKIRNLLPFSPAKEGPLATLHKVNIMGTIAETVKPAPLVNKMVDALSPIKNAFKSALPVITIPAKPIAETVKPAPLVASTSPVNITVNLGGINIYGKATEAEIEKLTDTFEKKIRAILDKIATDKFRREY